MAGAGNKRQAGGRNKNTRSLVRFYRLTTTAASGLKSEHTSEHK